MTERVGDAAGLSRHVATHFRSAEVIEVLRCVTLEGENTRAIPAREVIRFLDRDGRVLAISDPHPPDRFEEWADRQDPKGEIQAELGKRDLREILRCAWSASRASALEWVTPPSSSD